MFVELPRPLADHRPGDLIEVEPAAARTLAEQGYTRSPATCKSLDDFVRCVGANNSTRLQDAYNSLETETARGTESGLAGGYLIPEEMLAEILFPMRESLFHSRAMIAPMKSSTLDIPLLNTRATPSTGPSAFFGGTVAKWTEDGISLSELSPLLQNQSLKAHLLPAYVILSNTLLQDCPAHVADRLGFAFASA